MRISYKKLWKLLIDRDMMKKDLAKDAGISTASIAKLGRNENVNTDILLRICSACRMPPDIRIPIDMHDYNREF